MRLVKVKLRFSNFGSLELPLQCKEPNPFFLFVLAMTRLYLVTNAT